MKRERGVALTEWTERFGAASFETAAAKAAALAQEHDTIIARVRSGGAAFVETVDSDKARMAARAILQADEKRRPRLMIPHTLTAALGGRGVAQSKAALQAVENKGALEAENALILSAVHARDVGLYGGAGRDEKPFEYAVRDATALEPSLSPGRTPPHEMP